MKPTERFSDRADDYVAGRPSYPPEALDALFAGLGDPASIVVVDLGAGTGISSRLLAQRGAHVIAVEPIAARREAAGAQDGITWRAGTAEATGLPDRSANLVVAFQAFHWFRHAEALAEIARIARPGGRAALVYNERSDDNAATRAYSDLVRARATDRTEARRSDGRDAFLAYAGTRDAFGTSPGWASVRVATFENVQRLDRAGLRARTRSTSYLPKDGPAGDALHAAVDALFDEHAARGSVELHMRTIVTLAQLP